MRNLVFTCLLIVSMLIVEGCGETPKETTSKPVDTLHSYNGEILEKYEYLRPTYSCDLKIAWMYPNNTSGIGTYNLRSKEVCRNLQIGGRVSIYESNGIIKGVSKLKY